MSKSSMKGNLGGLTFGNIVVDILVGKPCDVFEELLLHIIGIREVPLPGRGKQVL